MAEEQEAEVPEGAAVFPLIPAELEIHPLLLAVLHATVFLSGSDDDVVNPSAAAETLEYMATCLERLKGPDMDRVRADMNCLVEFGRREKWPKQHLQFIKTFLADYGVGRRGDG
jgi:hypothetical protein